MTSYNKPLNEYLVDVLNCGNPADQIENFLSAGYVPQPKQLQFHVACRGADHSGGPRDIGFGGARGPGKSHAMFAQITLDDCQRYAGLKCLILRKVGKALKESVEDLRIKILKRCAHQYHKTTGTITFPNGSRVIQGHFKTEEDINAYLGLEYDLIAIEECTTLGGQKYRLIKTCCRTSKPNWRPRMYSNANPGGLGHAFYHRKFIKESEGTAFIPATYRDNAFLDSGYVETLEGLTGWLRSAWLLGDWNIHMGTYFTNFETAHVIEPHDVQKKGYQFYLVADYGFQHPTAAILLAVGGSNAYVIDEYSESKRLTPQHSKSLDAMLAKWGLERRHLRAFVLGQDAWQKGKDGTTVAGDYEKEGWHPEPAIMARVQGAQELLRRLGDTEAGIDPTLWFFENCVGVIEQVPQMQHDPKRPEDVLKVDVDEEGYGGDDLYDALRYGLQAIATDLGPITYDPLEFNR